MWFAIAREPGPGPADVAIGYERAWDELNFGLLWDLSGAELRDGMRRDQFIAAKRPAYANAGARGAHRRRAIEVETFGRRATRPRSWSPRVVAEGGACATT